MDTITVIQFTHEPDGVLASPTSVKLSDPTAAYGLKRTDTSEILVADGTDMTEISEGVFSYSLTDPAAGLTYDYWIEWVYDSETHRAQRITQGGAAASQNLYSLQNLVYPELGGRPTEPYIRNQLRAAAHWFLRLTELWREDLATLTSVADQADYTMAVAYDAYIQRVLAVQYNGAPYGFSRVSEDGITITLDPTPAIAGDDIDISVILLPIEANTTYPAWILQRWGHAIVLGTEGLLAAQADRPWFDPAGSAQKIRLFNGAGNDARIERQTLRGPMELSVKLRRFV